MASVTEVVDCCIDVVIVIIVERATIIENPSCCIDSDRSTIVHVEYMSTGGLMTVYGGGLGGAER